MKPNIFKSRKFWLMIWDVIVSLILTIGGWFLVPDAIDKISIVVGILQAPVIFLIGAIAYEDGKFMDNAPRSNEEDIPF